MDSDMIRVHLNDLLHHVRLSQRELARRTDTHPDVISRFAREATTAVSYDLLDRICRALDCVPGDLLEFVADGEQMPLFEEPGGTAGNRGGGGRAAALTEVSVRSGDRATSEGAR